MNNIIMAMELLAAVGCVALIAGTIAINRERIIFALAIILLLIGVGAQAAFLARTIYTDVGELPPHIFWPFLTTSSMKLLGVWTLFAYTAYDIIRRLTRER